MTTIDVIFSPANRARRIVGAIALAALALNLASCQPEPKPQTPVTAAPAHKHAHATRYAIDAARSTIALRVYRDGPLARFGHNHALTVTQIEGTVWRETHISQSDVELRFPIERIVVDAPAARIEAGTDFPGVLPPAAIAGTRQHMLGPQLLAAGQYPQITLRSISASGQWPNLQLLMEIDVRNFKSQIVLPVYMSETDTTLSADGNIKLSQVQMGLQPYSVLGGGLRVSDNIDAQFHIVAEREQTPQ